MSTSDSPQRKRKQARNGIVGSWPVIQISLCACPKGFNQVAVGKFFDLLQEVQSKFHFTPDKIFNCDETGMTTVPNKPSRIIAAKGKKQVGKLSYAEIGQLVTVELCMSASGNFVLPFFISPRCRMKPELLDKAPPGSQASAHPSGWMQSEIVVQWFDHFLQHANPSEASPVLLILDGHKTHTTNLEVINKAQEHHVTLLSPSSLQPPSATT